MTFTPEERRKRETDRVRTRRQAAALSGICVWCGGANTENGRRCADCRVKRREERQKAKEVGKCSQCLRPYTGPYAHCDECRINAAVLAKQKRNEDRAKGLCPGCGKKHDNGGHKSGSRYCDDCKIEQQEKRKNRVASKFCVRCPGLRDTKSQTCSACQKEITAHVSMRNALRDAQGCCLGCGGPRSDGQKKCETCVLKAVSSQVFGTFHRWQDLKDLFVRQGGKCSYTGVDLVISEARRSDQRFVASLDHKIPRSLGGADEIENLQWVSWLANRAKTNMTHEQFVELCRVVVQLESEKQKERAG